MKRILSTLRIAARALRRNKLRTLLTMLGIIGGVGAVIAAVSLTNGAKSAVEAQIASLGQNVVQVWSGSMTRSGIHTGWGGAGTLSIDDAEAVQREVPGVVAISPEVRSGAQVAAGNENWATQILGESDQYFNIRQWPIVQGQGFTEGDVRSANKVAVIGKTVADQLYPGEDPVGQIIRIKNSPFTVTGVLQSKGFNTYGADQDDVVIIPYTSAMKRLLGVTMLRMINAQAASPALLNPVEQQINGLFRQRHRIGEGKDDDFTVRNQQEIADAATQTTKTMTWLLGGIACVSLVVGGIGIMNIMLVSVTERTREIGIRMAVGARSDDILVQFLVEAVTLSALGGVVGIGLGIFGGRFLASLLNSTALTPVSWIGIAFVSSAIVGIISGFYPAWKASKLDPIDALRYE